MVAGRSGFHVFRLHPNHLSVLIQASMESRVERIMRKQNMTEEEARKTIERVDKMRENYVKKYTGTSRYDTRNYQLVIAADGKTTTPATTNSSSPPTARRRSRWPTSSCSTLKIDHSYFNCYVLNNPEFEQLLGGIFRQCLAQSREWWQRRRTQRNTVILLRPLIPPHTAAMPLFRAGISECAANK